ncbi:glycoside hydrolase/deacetylase [Ascodesmis nigricans]|uniref:Glycoside hydrolase/deacetylase n=1 Tax=Ascodesmis nigricans TaxID=341454 RepID=A0A4S2MHB1_9PEZI|nr:glycoside hydrolase/deacetylase [Ascodesmis nigricans]
MLFTTSPGLNTIFLWLTLTLSFINADSPTNRCGKQFGYTCRGTAVYPCCSTMGYCGETPDHCAVGKCQPEFGTCWGGNTTPTTPPTSGGRSRPGNVPYGRDIYRCTGNRQIALTFDDGPLEFTAELLDLLANEGVKATFFITGNSIGKGAIDSVQRWRNLIRRAYNEGHQIAAHTWDHPRLNGLSEADRRWQMTRLETAFLDILGRYPTYMRPPFSDCNAACRATMDYLGYHVIFWDVDTDDYNNNDPVRIENSRRKYFNAVEQYRSNYLVIAHDTQRETVRTLTKYMIDAARARGYSLVRVGDCLGDPLANWYRTTQ